VLTLRRSAAASAIAAMLLASPAKAGDASAAAFQASDGQTVAVSAYRGRWLLINYWATWCAPCLAEIPQLSRLADLGGRLSIVGVTDEALTAEQLRTFLATHPVSFLMIQTQRHAIPRGLPDSLLSVQLRPMSYLIQPDGHVAKRIIGPVNVADVQRMVQSRPASSAP
jgi:thiol-disulfide isomerase/thioredoxin